MLIIFFKKRQFPVLYQSLTVNTVGSSQTAQMGKKIIIISTFHSEGYIVAPFKFNVADLKHPCMMG